MIVAASASPSPAYLSAAVSAEDEFASQAHALANLSLCDVSVPILAEAEALLASLAGTLARLREEVSAS